MKLSQGFTRGGFTVLTILTMLASVALLSSAMKSIPLETAYSVWTALIGCACSLGGGYALVLRRELLVRDRSARRLEPNEL